MRGCAAAILATVVAAPAAAADLSKLDGLRITLGYSLRTNAPLSKLRERMMGTFRRADTDGSGDVSQADYDAADQIRAAQSRAIVVSQILRHDLDNDGRVTREELVRVFTPQSRAPLRSGGVTVDPTPQQARLVLDKLVESALAADADKDGAITLDEMRRYAAEKAVRPRHGPVPHPVPLELDTDGDGKVSLAEFTSAVDTLLKDIDKDGDGVVSDVERQAFVAGLAQVRRALAERERAAVERQAMLELARQCGLPPVPQGARLLVVGAHEGAALSTATIGSDDAVVHTALLDIQPGSEPLYVVAASYGPMIWQVTGDAARVRHLVLGSQHIQRWVGAVGVPRERITFMPKADCARRIGHPRKGGEATQRRLLAALFGGREPDAFVGRYTLARARLPLGTTFENGAFDNQAPLPQSEQARAEMEELYRFVPGGIVRIDPASVVASGPVADYKVLPRAAGLAQLIEKGVLEIATWGRAFEVGRTRVIGDAQFEGVRGVKVRRVPTAFRVIGPMTYPAGLHGGHGVRFIVARGVKAPLGNPGHSRVTCEATGEPIAAGAMCGP